MTDAWKNENPLIIYHGNCADGFTAAWAAWKKFGDAADYYPGVYQEPPPDVTGRRVVLVDFSYKRPVMAELAKRVIPDDHSSAWIFRMDQTYKGQLSWERHLGDTMMDQCEGCPTANIYALFDQARSGAGIAWDFFHPLEERPALVNHVEDRDLWKFQLDGTREIQAAVFSYPYEFGIWDTLAGTVDLLKSEGRAIERKHHKDVAELVDVCKRRMTIAGHDVPVASLPYTLTSDAGHLMAQGEPFAACYWDTAEGRIFSLRSTDEGMDVSEIAKQFGGGGHKNASGFKVPRDHEMARA
jgi:hypothetical protein